MDKKIVEHLEEESENYCLFGSCKDCTKIAKDGRGIHRVRTYRVCEYTEEEECEKCDGDGTTRHDCWECGGSGEVEEKCLDCDGDGQVPDEAGDEKFIRRRAVIVKES